MLLPLSKSMAKSLTPLILLDLTATLLTPSNLSLIRWCTILLGKKLSRGFTGSQPAAGCPFSPLALVVLHKKHAIQLNNSIHYEERKCNAFLNKQGAFLTDCSISLQYHHREQGKSKELCRVSRFRYMNQPAMTKKRSGPKARSAGS